MKRVDEPYKLNEVVCTCIGSRVVFGHTYRLKGNDCGALCPAGWQALSRYFCFSALGDGEFQAKMRDPLQAVSIGGRQFSSTYFEPAIHSPKAAQETLS